MDTPTVGAQNAELYDGDDTVMNRESSVEDTTAQDEFVLQQMLQKELDDNDQEALGIEESMNALSPTSSTQQHPVNPLISSVAESDEHELATRSPPTARVSAISHHHSIPRLDQYHTETETTQSEQATPDHQDPPTPVAPAPSSFVYESATYSPSFPSTVIYEEESEAPPPLALSPPQGVVELTQTPSSPPPSNHIQPPHISKTLGPNTSFSSLSISTPPVAPEPVLAPETSTAAATPTENPTAEPDTVMSPPALDAAPTSTAPPKSNIERLSDRLRDDPHDGQIWQVYINLVDQSGDTELVEAAYDRLVEAFPNTPTAQIAYLSHFLTPALFPKAEQLFARYLRASPSIDLWKFYLIYIRRVNANLADQNARNTIRKAYEFALQHIGQDKDAGEVWKDYIDFLKGTETHTTWDAQQKMDALRSAYHRAVVIPIENVEILWRELDSFETNLNKITAKKFLGDLSPSYMTARTSLRDIRRLMEPLSIPQIKLPAGGFTTAIPLHLPARPTWIGEADRNLVQAWKAYLKWEESNPLVIEDTNVLASRVNMAYRKAVIRMRFFPEIWFMAYNHLISSGKQDDALVLLKQGMDANPSSFLLHFAYAELCESLSKLPEAHSAFDSLLNALHTELERLETSISAEVEAVRASVPAPASAEANGELAIERDEREKAVMDKRGKELDGMKGELGVVWIMLMRFARRAEGLRPARGIFTKARKDKWCPWSVYESAALMEYHATKTADVSTKIFELGMKQFATDVDFVVRYLGFLISINDDTNARALFESAIANFTPDKARPLWERWARYEYHFGDLAATQKLEKRIIEVYPNDPPIKRFAQRYTYLGIDTIAGRDLGFAQRSKQQPPVAAVLPANSFSSTSASAPPPPERTIPPPRRSSPEPRRRREPSPPPAKRFKASSPPPARRDRGRDRDRDHRRDDTRREDSGPASRRPSPPPMREAIPPAILWFLGTLPSANAFDGPVFRTEDLMELLRHGNIPPPSDAPRPPPPRARSPPPARGPPPRRGRY